MPLPLWLTRFLLRTGMGSWLPGVARHAEGGTDGLHYLSDRGLHAPRKDLRDAAAVLERRGTDLIDLASAAPRFDALPAGWAPKLGPDQRGLPPALGLAELREAVVQQLRADHGLDLAVGEEVLITAGATGALHLALDTFLAPGDRAVLFDPSPHHYAMAVRHRRGRVAWVPTEVDQGRLRFALARLVPLLRRARMLLLCTPHSPTGAVLAPEDLEQIAWYCHREDVLIVSDQAYERFQYDGPFVSVATFPKAEGHTLLVNSLSKSHALTAFRVGWLAGHRRLLRACAMTAFQQGAVVPTVCQQVALAALRADPETLQPYYAEFAQRRRAVGERLKLSGLRIPWPAGGLFFWLPIQGLNLTGRKFAEQLQREKRVLVLPGELFGPGGQGFVRVSYTNDEARLKDGLKRLLEFIRQKAPMAAPAPSSADLGLSAWDLAV